MAAVVGDPTPPAFILLVVVVVVVAIGSDLIVKNCIHIHQTQSMGRQSIRSIRQATPCILYLFILLQIPMHVCVGWVPLSIHPSIGSLYKTSTTLSMYVQPFNPYPNTT